MPTIASSGVAVKMAPTETETLRKLESIEIQTRLRLYQRKITIEVLLLNGTVTSLYATHGMPCDWKRNGPHKGPRQLKQ